MSSDPEFDGSTTPASGAFWQTIFERSTAGLAVVDPSGHLVQVNLRFARMLETTVGELTGRMLSEVIDESDFERIADSIELVRNHEFSFETELQYATAHGGLWVIQGMHALTGPAGEPGWIVVSAQDVSDRRLAEQGLRDLTGMLVERAVRDALTGVANKVLLEERIRGAQARAARSGGSNGLLYLDLDGFKAVNDTHGHAAGDAVLQEVARRLTASCRPRDTIARLGGDEFVILAEEAGAAELDALARDVERRILLPIEWDNDTLQVGASIGKALSAAGAEDAATLIDQGDRAMYEIKESRKKARLNRRADDQP